MNISQTKHQKPFIIGVHSTTDIGSGVYSLEVWGQAVNNITDAADIDNADLIGRVIDVDNTPSYSDIVTTNVTPYFAKTLLVRNKDSYPVSTSTDKIPKQTPHNVYAFIFDTYINGKYYHIWVLAVDKAGNKEVLNTLGTVNSKDTPLFTTTEKLLDDLPPEFDNITTLPDITWNGSNYKFPYTSLGWTVADNNAANSYVKDRIIVFAMSGVKKVRYVQSATKSGTDIILDIDITGLTGNPDVGSPKLLPLVTGEGGVGYLELTYPLSQAINFDKVKIERTVANSSTEPLATDNINKETDFPTWILVGYFNSNKHIDRGLILSKTNLEDITNNSSAKKFLYKVSPVSIWTDTSNVEILGEPIYSTTLNFNTTNYRACAGNIPNNIVTTTTTNNANGSITLEWDEPIDTNGDLEGYIIQRQRLLNGTAEVWTEISSLNKGDYSSGTLNKKFIDDGLEPYQPDIITYKYRIKAFDWAGNLSGGWLVFNSGVAIASTDTVVPLVSGTNSSLAVTGKIGGWKGQTSFVDVDIKAVDVWGKSAHLSTSVDAATEVFIGRFGVAIGEKKIDFTWFDAPSSTKWYAKFDYRLIDKYDNESLRKGYLPAIAVYSETPKTVIDAFAPSVYGFTVTPVVVPDITLGTIKVTTVKASNTITTFSIKIGTGQAILQDELVGKNLVHESSGETRVIQSNSTSDGSTNIPITLKSGLSIAPSLNNIVSLSPSHVRVAIDKQNSITGTATGSISSGNGYTGVIDTTKTWATDQWEGWLLTIGGETSQVASNTTDTLTLKDTLVSDPTAAAYTVSLPTDLAGFNIFRGKLVATVVENWVQVTDTKDPYTTLDIFDIIDRNISPGTYKYGVTAYDLSGNESSPIKKSITSVSITDDVAPGIPTIQGVIGGAGSLLIYWNRTADDIAFYKLTILDDLGVTVLAETSILGASYTLYGVIETKINIKKYKYKIVAYDTSGNSITGTSASAISDAIEFLDDYVPSTGNVPLPITGMIVSGDKDGNANVTIPKANIVDHTIKLIIVSRDTKIMGGAYSGAYTVIGSFAVPSLDSSDVYLDDIHFKDNINDRVTVKYQVDSISFGGQKNTSPFTETTGHDIVDFTGYSLASLSTLPKPTITPDTGKVFMKFRDVLDINSATYEIWRTSDTVTVWDGISMFTNITIQPFVIDPKWEKIATLPSTRSNNTQTDFVQYSDLDWQPNGTISDEDTTLALPYNAKAVYAVIGVDRWGNRGAPFFLPNGTNDANSVIYVPHEPRVNRIEKNALYCDFNKGVQLNRGDVPSSDIDAILHKGYGIEVLGDLKYNLDKLSGDYSLVVRRLEKSLINLNLTNMIDIFVYDTSTDNVDYNSIVFPQIALFVASATDVKLYEYNSMTLKDTFTPILTNGTITKIYFKNGKLYVGSSSSVVTENYINDYPAGTISAMHNSGSNINDIYISTYNGTNYEIVSTNSKVTISDGVKTIKSAGNGTYKNITVRKGYVYVFKDIYVYKSKVTLSNMDFSIDNVEISLFDIFLDVGSNLKSLIENNDNLLIADDASVYIIDNSERKLRVGQMLNTIIPFLGNGVLCSIFEQIISSVLLTENDMILLTENNYKIIV